MKNITHALASFLLIILIGGLLLSTESALASCGDSYEQCLVDAVDRYYDHGDRWTLRRQTEFCDADLWGCTLFGLT